MAPTTWEALVTVVLVAKMVQPSGVITNFVGSAASPVERQRALQPPMDKTALMELAALALPVLKGRPVLKGNGQVSLVAQASTATLVVEAAEAALAVEARTST